MTSPILPLARHCLIVRPAARRSLADLADALGRGGVPLEARLAAAPDTPRNRYEIAAPTPGAQSPRASVSRVRSTASPKRAARSRAAGSRLPTVSLWRCQLPGQPSASSPTRQIAR